MIKWLFDANAPRLYCVGLMNSFRIETLNISSSGRTESFFLQGGLRWQSIALVSNSSINISGVGIRPSVTIQDPQELQGSFAVSNDMYSDVWNLGAVAAQGACVEAGTQPSTWEISNDGALIRGQFPATSAKAVDFADYTLEFSTKIISGGTGWRVAGGANDGYGAYFVLTSSGPALESRNVTSLPSNSLVAGYGFSIINQTILSSATPRTYELPISFQDDTWYRITTSINSTGYAISVDGQSVAFVTSDVYQDHVDATWGSGATNLGTFGFGPYLNQAAYFKDVQVTDKNGTIIYTNDFSSDDVLQEYSVASNQYTVCLDGAKRDRAVWIGDFAHTARIIASSSGHFSHIQGVIDFEFDWQYPPGPAEGLVPIQALPGAGKQYREVFYPVQFGETDYQFFFMLTLGDYFALTSDTDRLSKNWEGTKLLVQTQVDRYLDTATNLMASTDASWFTAQGQQNASAPTALFVTALNQLVNVATVLGDSSTAASWRELTTNISTAINSQLWSDDLGAYAVSLADLTDASMLGIAFSIRSGIASADQATRSIAALDEQLFLDIGYKDASSAPDAASTQLSPNTQGFLLEALFLAHLNQGVTADAVVGPIRKLTEGFWPLMVTQDQYFTGASWEYLYPDGSPGIGIFTSLAHPWGGAPTYVYSNYILGVRPRWNETSAAFEWVFSPVWEIAQGLGLEWAKGKVPLPDGGYVEAEWSVTNGTRSLSHRVVDSGIPVHGS
jgi:hypothetical protein